MVLRWSSLVIVGLAFTMGTPAVMAQNAPPPATGTGGQSVSNLPPYARVASVPASAPSPDAPVYQEQPPFSPAGPTAGVVFAADGPPCPQNLPPAPDHFTPYMLGDFIGPLGSTFSSLKVAEGSSPRPIDRVFYDFNYFNNLNKNQWNNPISSELRHVDLYQNLIGFEKTFFDQQMSLTIKVPFQTLNEDPRPGVIAPADLNGLHSTDLGNLSVIAKGILWEDKATGNLLSGGATLSFPTGATRDIDPGPSTLAYIQPFVAGIVQQGDFFAQGFTSLTFPVARTESILLFIDLGVGYFVYRNPTNKGILRSIAPTLEVHVSSPLRSADPAINLFGLNDALRLHNEVDLTMGSTFEFTNRSTLAFGVVVPTTGPKDFDVEAILQFNYRF